MRTPITAIIAISIGTIVLLGYFIEIPVLVTLADIFIQWAIILASVALIVGITNLFSVHWRKISNRQKDRHYSIILIISLAITIIVVGFSGPTGSWSLWVFNYVHVPIESSLMALLAVLLVIAVVRFLKRKVNLFALIFVGSVLIILLGSAPWLGVEIPGIHGPFGLRSLLTQIPSVGGARGILLGVALGVIATGLRVLIGADRPYEG